MMTSRERVAAALAHREPDRVPVDMGGSVVSGIMATAYAALRRWLGIDGDPPKVCDILQMLAEVEAPVMEKLGCDVAGLLPLTRSFGIARRDWKPWRAFDGTEVLVPGQFNYRVDDNGDLLLSPGGDSTKTPSGKMPKDGHYFDMIERQEPFDWHALDPDEFAEQFTLLSDEELEYVRTRSEILHRDTDFAILGGFGGAGLGNLPEVLAPHIERPKGVRNIEDWMIAHLTHPEYINEIFERQAERGIENLELYRQAVGDRIAAIFISGTDFGTQRGEFISPDLYRELYMPHHKRMNDWVHANTHWKTFYHTCGSVYHLIPDFIEAGVDVLNPIQCSAANMVPERLKQEFGGRIVIWGGGVDTQRTLPFGTPEQVSDEVAERLRVFAPGGGYVFGTVHNIQAKTPVESILAAFDTVRERGRYPVGAA
jgi:uroporphyrinogen-III decarboxylase